MSEALLTTAEAAAVMCLSSRTLERYRQKRCGPIYIRQGGKIFYRKGAILKWQEENSYV